MVPWEVALPGVVRLRYSLPVMEPFAMELNAGNGLYGFHSIFCCTGAGSTKAVFWVPPQLLKAPGVENLAFSDVTDMAGVGTVCRGLDRILETSLGVGV